MPTESSTSVYYNPAYKYTPKRAQMKIKSGEAAKALESF
jgi:hypothetical protein